MFHYYFPLPVTGADCVVSRFEDAGAEVAIGVRGSDKSPAPAPERSEPGNQVTRVRARARETLGRCHLPPVSQLLPLTGTKLF